MNPFFSTQTRIQILIEQASRWKGTPFCHHASSIGHGVDCVHLACEIYSPCGFTVWGPAMPQYTMDGGIKLDESLLERYINCCGNFSSILVTETLPGDLLLFKTGRVTHHVGVKTLGNRFVQAIKKFGVIETELHGTFFRALAKAFRPMEG